MSPHDALKTSLDRMKDDTDPERIWASDLPVRTWLFLHGKPIDAEAARTVIRDALAELNAAIKQTNAAIKQTNAAIEQTNATIEQATSVIEQKANSLDARMDRLAQQVSETIRMEIAAARRRAFRQIQLFILICGAGTIAGAIVGFAVFKLL